MKNMLTPLDRDLARMLGEHPLRAVLTSLGCVLAAAAFEHPEHEGALRGDAKVVMGAVAKLSPAALAGYVISAAPAPAEPGPLPMMVVWRPDGDDGYITLHALRINPTVSGRFVLVEGPVPIAKEMTGRRGVLKIPGEPGVDVTLAHIIPDRDDRTRFWVGFLMIAEAAPAPAPVDPSVTWRPEKGPALVLHAESTDHAPGIRWIRMRLGSIEQRAEMRERLVPRTGETGVLEILGDDPVSCTFAGAWDRKATDLVLVLRFDMTEVAVTRGGGALDDLIQDGAGPEPQGAQVHVADVSLPEPPVEINHPRFGEQFAELLALAAESWAPGTPPPPPEVVKRWPIADQERIARWAWASTTMPRGDSPIMAEWRRDAPELARRYFRAYESPQPVEVQVALDQALDRRATAPSAATIALWTRAERILVRAWAEKADRSLAWPDASAPDTLTHALNGFDFRAVIGELSMVMHPVPEAREVAVRWSPNEREAAILWAQRVLREGRVAFGATPAPIRAIQFRSMAPIMIEGSTRLLPTATEIFATLREIMSPAPQMTWVATLSPEERISLYTWALNRPEENQFAALDAWLGLEPPALKPWRRRAGVPLGNLRPGSPASPTRLPLVAEVAELLEATLAGGAPANINTWSPAELADAYRWAEARPIRAEDVLPWHATIPNWISDALPEEGLALIPSVETLCAALAALGWEDSPRYAEVAAWAPSERVVVSRWTMAAHPSPAEEPPMLRTWRARRGIWVSEVEPILAARTTCHALGRVLDVVVPAERRIVTWPHPDREDVLAWAQAEPKEGVAREAWKAAMPLILKVELGLSPDAAGARIGDDWLRSIFGLRGRPGAKLEDAAGAFIAEHGWPARTDAADYLAEAAVALAPVRTCAGTYVVGALGDTIPSCNACLSRLLREERRRAVVEEALRLYGWKGEMRWKTGITTSAIGTHYQLEVSADAPETAPGTPEYLAISVPEGPGAAEEALALMVIEAVERAGRWISMTKPAHPLAALMQSSDPHRPRDLASLRDLIGRQYNEHYRASEDLRERPEEDDPGLGRYHLGKAHALLSTLDLLRRLDHEGFRLVLMYGTLTGLPPALAHLQPPPTGAELEEYARTGAVPSRDVPTDPPDGMYLPPRLLVENGLVFRINREVLHPLGLALVVETEERQPGRIKGVWSVLDQTGITFSAEDMAAGQAKVEAYRRRCGQERHRARLSTLGYVMQPLLPANDELVEGAPPGQAGGIPCVFGEIEFTADLIGDAPNGLIDMRLVGDSAAVMATFVQLFGPARVATLRVRDEARGLVRYERGRGEADGVHLFFKPTVVGFVPASALSVLTEATPLDVLQWLLTFATGLATQEGDIPARLAIARRTVYRLVEDAALADKLIALLSPHAGTTGANEGAEDVLRRLLNELAERRGLVGGFLHETVLAAAAAVAASATNPLLAAADGAQHPDDAVVRAEGTLSRALEMHRVVHDHAALMMNFVDALRASTKTAEDGLYRLANLEIFWGQAMLAINASAG